MCLDNLCKCTVNEWGCHITSPSLCSLFNLKKKKNAVLYHCNVAEGSPGWSLDQLRVTSRRWELFLNRPTGCSTDFTASLSNTTNMADWGEKLSWEGQLSVHHSLVTVFVFTSPALRYCYTHSLDVDWLNEIHVVVFTDAENFEPEEPIKKAAAMDKWEGEDEDEDVKVN